jgi:hypothetical protein
MAYYIDSRPHYELRQKQVTWAALRRAYYEGFPYNDNPLRRYVSYFWETLMAPTDRKTRRPRYYDNVARTIIENTVNDILPSESAVRITGTDDMTAAELQKLHAALFNFGPGYEQGPGGFLAWAKRCLTDTAQTQSGLIFLRLMPPIGSRGTWIAWHYYPFEAWTAEQDEVSADPLFYRIEYKYDKVDNEKRTTFWHRVDIWRDHLVRYMDTPALVNNFDNDVPQGAMLFTTDSFASILPPKMTMLEDPNGRDNVERSILTALSGWVCVPLIWDRVDVSELEGASALRTNRLQAIDEVNRLITEWADAAIQHGNPDLVAIDLDVPGDEAIEQGQAVTDKFGAADIMQTISTGMFPGKMVYPDNMPTSLLHKAPLDSLRQAVFEGDPNFSIDPATIGRFGELSGFASGQLNRNHDSKIKALRDDLLTGGLLVALRRAMELLDAVGELPDGVDPEARLTVKLAGRNFSPQEELQMASTFAALQDRGVPAEDLLAYARKFLDIHDESEFLAGLAEYKTVTEKLRQLTQVAKQTKPTAAKQTAAGDNQPGVDNRLK